MGFIPLDPNEEETVMRVIADADMCLQFMEQLEPKEADYEDSERLMNEMCQPQTNGSPI